MRENCYSDCANVNRDTSNVSMGESKKTNIKQLFLILIEFTGGSSLTNLSRSTPYTDYNFIYILK